MFDNVLAFDASVGMTKSAQSARTPQCPFCHPESLSGLVATQDEIILLRNKYATLAATTQLVLIESRHHSADISTYHESEWRKILTFALEQWGTMISTGKYRSVLLYKNYGPLSGGSQQHPHMQIVGLSHSDGYADVESNYFVGYEVVSMAGVTVNFSEDPIMGFLEINVIWSQSLKLNQPAYWIQHAIQFVLNQYYQGRCDSYNLCFYKLRDKYIAKIIPRFIDSPYFVGYRISQRFTKNYMQVLKGEFLKFKVVE